MAAVKLYQMLDNGEAKTCSSCFSGTGLVESVKSLKNPLLILGGNPRTIVFDFDLIISMI